MANLGAQREERITSVSGNNRYSDAAENACRVISDQTFPADDMQVYSFDVYDIDGTLTVPGHDLWYLCTRSLSADEDLFDTYVAEWKTEIHSGMDSFERSLAMMQRGLKLLKNGIASEVVTREVKRIASKLIDEGLVCRQAINFLRGRIHSGVRAVFVTTNYHEGAVGFLLALLAKGWIRETELEKILVSGSRIDWSSRVVNHFNMGSDKVIGLLDALGISEEALKGKIGFAFADDPLGSDRNLLEIASYPYVIKNETHRYLDLPDRVKLITWSEVEAMSVSELARLHTDAAYK